MIEAIVFHVVDAAIWTVLAVAVGGFVVSLRALRMLEGKA